MLQTESTRDQLQETILSMVMNQRVFMQKIKGHRLEEEKLAFVFDSKDKTPKHKEDVLR